VCGGVWGEVGEGVSGGQAIARVGCHYTVPCRVMNEGMTYSNLCSNTSF